MSETSVDDGTTLLRAIIDQPEEDTPRLMYADWLDENPAAVTCMTCGGCGSVKTDVPSLYEAYGFVTTTGIVSPCTYCEGSGLMPPGYRAARAAFIRADIGFAAGTVSVEERQAAVLSSPQYTTSDLYGWAWYNAPSLITCVPTGERGFVHRVSVLLAYANDVPFHETVMANHPITRVGYRGRRASLWPSYRQPRKFEGRYAWGVPSSPSSVGVFNSLPVFLAERLAAHRLCIGVENDWVVFATAADSQLAAEECAAAHARDVEQDLRIPGYQKTLR